jgi:tRNA modification GTPase
MVQAEAVADLIDAGTAAAARAAMRSLRGEFSARIGELQALIMALRVHVEAAIDFPDEGVEVPADPAVTGRLAHVLAVFDSIESAARQGALLREGFTAVIAGRPNAGKSSLLNRLAGEDIAIVTPSPGTTRDVLRQPLAVDGLPLTLIDTAGLRRRARGHPARPQRDASSRSDSLRRRREPRRGGARGYGPRSGGRSRCRARG